MSTETTGRRWVRELRTLPAFMRRDLGIAWSYRLGFFSDAANLIFQTALFYFVGQIVDSESLPQYGDQPTSYLSYVAIGIALGGFLQLGLNQVATAVRTEQYMGTLETLMIAPVPPALLQVGMAMYNLIYVPIRTVLFLALVAALYGISFTLVGLPAAVVIILLFIPMTYGIGLVGAAFMLTFRRGGGLVGIVGFVLSVSSGAYFPVELLPTWMAPLVRFNPIALAFEASRQALLGGATLIDLRTDVLLLLLSAVLALWGGSAAMNWALRRERRMGTLGLY